MFLSETCGQKLNYFDRNEVEIRFERDISSNAFLHRSLTLRPSDFNFRTSKCYIQPQNIFYVRFDYDKSINAAPMLRNSRKKNIQL
jgi:hypothetical protein